MKIKAEEMDEVKTSGKDFDFRTYVAEGWMHKAVNEAEDSNAPKVGTKAKDYAGEEVEIVDVLRLPASQRDLDWFLDQYDDSGIMRDCYRDPEGYDFDPDNYDYYVAVESPSLNGTAVYVWGPEGVCYSGEDLKEGCHKVNELKREPKQATKSDLKGFASKEATLNRAKRAEKGNWKNSVGAFVEKHSAEIGNVSPLGKAALVNYIETKMKPELSDEAKAKVDELVNSSRSVTDLMFALYNTMLKGAGMGLHEDLMSEEADGQYRFSSRAELVDGIEDRTGFNRYAEVYDNTVNPGKRVLALKFWSQAWWKKGSFEEDPNKMNKVKKAVEQFVGPDVDVIIRHGSTYRGNGWVGVVQLSWNPNEVLLYPMKSRKNNG